MYAQGEHVQKERPKGKPAFFCIVAVVTALSTALLYCLIFMISPTPHHFTPIVSQNLHKCTYVNAVITQESTT